MKMNKLFSFLVSQMSTVIKIFIFYCLLCDIISYTLTCSISCAVRKISIEKAIKTEPKDFEFIVEKG